MRVLLCLLLASACADPAPDPSVEAPTPPAARADEAAPPAAEPLVAEPVAAPAEEPAIVPVTPVEATGTPEPSRERVRTSSAGNDRAALRHLRSAEGAEAIREARRDPARAREILRNAQRASGR